jgi:hypothetical protein
VGIAADRCASESVNSRVDLYWLPLGAGGQFVRLNGRVYERWSAWREHRPPSDLYHSGLMISAHDIRYAVEMGPVWNVSDSDRGVLCVGSVGSQRLGRLRMFRYEVRCWPGGQLPDVAEAIASPVRTTDDPARAVALLAVLKQVPPLVWGRDELGSGDMWNSNSVVAWALARTGHDMGAIRAPAGGRAPGWKAGLELARRQG